MTERKAMIACLLLSLCLWLFMAYAYEAEDKLAESEYQDEIAAMYDK